MSVRRDTGEALVEIVLSIVIVSLTVTALVSALATAIQAGTAQRNSVTTDVVMRDFAEATKSAAQQCTPGGAFTVTFTPPAGYQLASTAPSTCPDPATAAPVRLTVTAPSGAVSTMQLRVRTP